MPAVLRIACGGLAAAAGGSVASAGYEILRELLDRGHEVDFYSKPSYVYPEGLVEHPSFHYIDCSQRRIDATVARMPSAMGRWVGGTVANALTAQRIVTRMRHGHRRHSYDLEFFLGQWAFGRVPGVPVVSWVQGPPGTDSRSVIRHRKSIRLTCGWKEYLQLQGFAVYRSSWGRPPFRHTDVTICGSQWSVDTLVSRYAMSVATTMGLPYPIDLDLFHTAPSVAATEPLTLTWVGRIVPRKRLDLFLDAGARLIRDGRNVNLIVVGSLPFAAGFSELLDSFPFQDRLTYMPNIPRDQIPGLLHATSVLVQPSEEENFGSSVAEALACGTPVVVGPTNGTGEYINGGGKRFERYEASDVADAISRILDQPVAATDAMRRDGRRAAEAQFAASHVAERLESIFIMAIHTRDSGPVGQSWPAMPEPLRGWRRSREQGRRLKRIQAPRLWWHA